MHRIVVLISALLYCSYALTDTVAGRVVGITDGDTLTILQDREQIKIRLVDIDAPEKDQPFEQRSKQSLSDLCFQKEATGSTKGKDRYGRTLATVHCEGVDANAEQVRRGLAWVYRKYAPKNSPLYVPEDAARRSESGLWADRSGQAVAERNDGELQRQVPG
jgi:endonuclease YncB( thermonuclease family)